MNKNNFSSWAVGVLVVLNVILVLILGPWPMAWSAKAMHNYNMGQMMDIDDQALAMEQHREYITSNLLASGRYTCCLTIPCSYCIAKTPGHGEGATCDCLEDIVNGQHPCGECIGEILEGHGNKYLSKYFAKSISEEVGEEYLSTLRDIIKDKYDISIEEQL